MTPLIIETVDYVEAGKAGPLLGPLEAQLGTLDLRVMSIKVLGWIKGRVRLKKAWQLPLNMEHRWSQNIRDVIEREKAFSDVFQITSENKSDFNARLLSGERDEIEKYVDARHSPPLFTARVN